MIRQKLLESLNSAVEGFIYVLKTQRNMRLHFLMAALVLVLGIFFNLPKLELLVILFAVMLVLVLEKVNTAMELTIDLVKESYHPLARIIKDITAGAVFLASMTALIVGYIIFSGRFALHIEEGINKIAHSPWHLTFITLILVLLIVVLVKVAFQRGTPFRGGMPSGHAAFAFAMWTVIAFSTRNGLIIMLSFFMAFLIALHRLRDKVHTAWEVLIGAVIGVLAAAVVFQFLA